MKEVKMKKGLLLINDDHGNAGLYKTLEDANEYLAKVLKGYIIGDETFTEEYMNSIDGKKEIIAGQKRYVEMGNAINYYQDYKDENTPYRGVGIKPAEIQEDKVLGKYGVKENVGLV